MKNIKYIFSMLLMMALGLGACSDDLSQPPVTLPEGGIGTGAWDSPMTAYQASLGSVNEAYGETVWVKGYIVGVVNTGVANVLKEETADFSVPAPVNTNILIAMTPNERNWENCVPVQLPSGDVRNALNLASNPGNQGKLVTIYGVTGLKYCSAYGVKSVSKFNWGEEGIEPDPLLDLPAGSKTIVEYNFLNGMNGFVFDQGNPATAGYETWKLDAKYGLKATGGVTGSSAIATDAMAISSEIDLAGFGTIRMNVHQAANFFQNTEGFDTSCKVLVREVGGNWEAQPIPIPLGGMLWTFFDSGYMDLDKYAGKKIQVAFQYTSTTQLSGTWEVDKLKIAGVRQ